MSLLKRLLHLISLLSLRFALFLQDILIELPSHFFCECSEMAAALGPWQENTKNEKRVEEGSSTHEIHCRLNRKLAA